MRTPQPGSTPVLVKALTERAASVSRIHEARSNRQGGAKQRREQPAANRQGREIGLVTLARGLACLRGEGAKALSVAAKAPVRAVRDFLESRASALSAVERDDLVAHLGLAGGALSRDRVHAWTVAGLFAGRVNPAFMALERLVQAGAFRPKRVIWSPGLFVVRYLIVGVDGSVVAAEDRSFLRQSGFLAELSRLCPEVQVMRSEIPDPTWKKIRAGKLAPQACAGLVREAFEPRMTWQQVVAYAQSMSMTPEETIDVMRVVEEAGIRQPHAKVG